MMETIKWSREPIKGLAVLSQIGKEKKIASFDYKEKSNHKRGKEKKATISDGRGFSRSKEERGQRYWT